MKSVYEIMMETDRQQTGLALIYIEFEKTLFRKMRNKDDNEIARLEGTLKGILISADLLGVNDFYGKTITPLRNAIQDEENIYKEQCKKEEKE